MNLESESITFQERLEKIVDSESAMQEIRQQIKTIEDYAALKFENGLPQVSEGTMIIQEKNYQTISKKASEFLDVSETDKKVKKFLDKYFKEVKTAYQKWSRQ